jgi:hypothetical protein
MIAGSPGQSYAGKGVTRHARTTPASQTIFHGQDTERKVETNAF